MKALLANGGSLMGGPILYSRDDAVLLACHDDAILVLDGRTGLFLRRLSGAHGAIVALALHPTLEGVVVGATATGHVAMWNYQSGLLAGEIDFVAPSKTGSERVIAMHAGPAVLLLETVCGDAGKEQPSSSPATKTTIWRLATNADQSPAVRVATAAHAADALPTLVALSADGTTLAYTEGGLIVILDAAAPDVAAESRARQTVSVGCNGAACLALGPRGDVVYWADRRGCIRSAGTRSAQARPQATMHWHARAPAALHAAPTGSHVLSGGEEGVLVVWDLRRSYKHFLPHLNAPILRVTSNGAGDMYALLTAANEVLLVSPANMQIVGRHDGLKAGLAQRRHAGAVGLVRDPRGETAFFVGGALGRLQSYDVVRGAVYGGDHDVCLQNVVGRGKSEAPLTFSDVYAAATSSDGRWMATYDRRTTECRRLHHDALKFWRLRNGQFHLATAFDVPHGEPIRQIVFCPMPAAAGEVADTSRPGAPRRLYRVATVGEDAKVKFWSSAGRRVVAINGDGRTIESTAWVQTGCITSKSEQMTAAAYSPDGTVLALSFGSLIRLYSTEGDRGDLLATLSNSNGNKEAHTYLSGTAPTLDESSHLAFIGSDGRFLVSGASSTTSRGQASGYLTVWDCERLSIRWTVSLPIGSICPSSDDSHFAAIVIASAPAVASEGVLRKRRRTAVTSLRDVVMHFDVASPVPIHCYRHTAPIDSIALLDCPRPAVTTVESLESPTAPSSDGDVMTVILDVEGRITVLGDEARPLCNSSLVACGNEATLVERARAQKVVASKMGDALQAAPRLRPSAKAGSEGRKRAAIALRTPSLAKAVLSTVPGHLLPATGDLFDTYMQNMLPPRTSGDA